jgi:hypothetical protein
MAKRLHIFTIVACAPLFKQNRPSKNSKALNFYSDDHDRGSTEFPVRQNFSCEKFCRTGTSLGQIRREVASSWRRASRVAW